VRQAHQDESEETAAARARLIEKYGDAIRRYLMACLRDPDAVDEVYQEFSLKFVQGKFSGVTADKGRFRSYIKTVIYHLVADYGRSRKKYAATAIEHESLLTDNAQADGHSLDMQFQESWRDSLLTNCWQRLEQEERESGKPWYTVLKLRSENGNARSAELAELATSRVGKEITAANVRVLVHRARERFAELLTQTVKDSLDNPSPEELEHELIDLNLWQYCKPILQQEGQ
jgi:RNA polymerase sigma-70 factor (ECF subfamily)